MKTLFFIVSLLFVSLISFANANTTLVLYSSINIGHIQAATELKTSLIKSGISENTIELIDIRDFKGPISSSISAKVYNYLVTYHPNLLNKFYNNFVSQGNSVMSLSRFDGQYDSERLLNLITQKSPGTILTTHYGAAQSLGTLREKGELKNIKLGWVYTDFTPAYFPRISKSLDRTFLASEFIANDWIKKGVDPSKIAVSGILPRSEAMQYNRSSLFQAAGLQNDRPSIVVNFSNRIKKSEFSSIIESIATRNRQPIQIITNKPIKKSVLSKIQQDYPAAQITHVSDVGLFEGLVKEADVLVTSSSYIGETMNSVGPKRLVVYDNTPGIDHSNIQALTEAGLIESSNKTFRIGYLVNEMLTVKADSVLANQRHFHGEQNTKLISDFVKSPSIIHDTDDRLGIENGTTVLFTKEALAKLEKDSPADIEIILSYGKYPNGDFFTNDGNPFGHLAIKVKDKVYTVNGKATRGVETNGIHVSSLEDYLYSINRTNVNEEHTDTFGGSYARHNISIRVGNVSDTAIQQMMSFIDKKQDGWRNDEWTWKAREYNCADFVVDALKAGNFIPKDYPLDEKKKHQFTFPLDVFDSYLEFFENNPTFRTEISGYTFIPDSRNLYRRPTFPFSAYQLRRLMKNMKAGTVDTHEQAITKRIAFYPTDYTAHYENVDGSSVHDAEKKLKEQELAVADSFKSLQITARNFEAKQKRLVSEGLTSDTLYKTLNSSDESSVKKLADWNTLQKDLQTDLDQLIVQQLDHFALKIMFYVESAYLSLSHRVTPTDFNSLKNLYESTNQAYSGYLKMKPRYGQAKDIPRTAKYREIYEKAEQFIKLADYLNGTKLPQETKSKNVRLYLKLGKEALAVVWKLISTGTQSTATFNQSMKFARTFGEDVGAKVDVTGGDIIKNLPQEKGTVNILAPIHRHPLWDLVALANLNIDGALPFIFFPKPVARFITKHVTNVIAVGGGSDMPIDHVISELNKGYTSNILVYPEGSVSAGMMETRPAREKFSWGLVRTLREQGFKVNIIPISYENTAKFGNENTIETALNKALANPEKITYRVDIGKPLNSKMIDKMLLTDPLMIGRYIRSFWLEKMKTTNTLLSGQLRPTEMDRLVDNDFKPKFVELKLNQCLSFYR